MPSTFGTDTVLPMPKLQSIDHNQGSIRPQIIIKIKRQTNLMKIFHPRETVWILLGVPCSPVGHLVPTTATMRQQQRTALVAKNHTRGFNSFLSEKFYYMNVIS
jgi:hypothetical protein